MKKTVLVILVAVVASFLMPSSASAQVKFGIKAGANVSKMYLPEDLLLKTDNTVGFLVGPLLDVKIPVLGLGFDLAAQYSYKKAKISNENENTSATLQHIEVPLNIKWTFGNDNGFSVYIGTGPQIAWNIGGQSFKEVTDLGQYTMKSSVFSWNAGLGCTIARHVRLGYTYNIGIGNTADIDWDAKIDEKKVKDAKNNSHQIFLAYFF